MNNELVDKSVDGLPGIQSSWIKVIFRWISDSNPPQLGFTEIVKSRNRMQRRFAHVVSVRDASLLPKLAGLKPGDEVQVCIETNWSAEGMPTTLKDVCKVWGLTDEVPRFLSRDAVLHDLHQALTSQRKIYIHGTAGCGKTQTAIAYARRYENLYDRIFWVNASSELELRSAYTGIARKLNLPEVEEASDDAVSNAVKEWLNREKNWLLVVDNIDASETCNTEASITSCLPSSEYGRILLTQRADSTLNASGAGQKILSNLSPKEGALFLLRRSGLASETQANTEVMTHSPDWRSAVTLSEELIGLPLALDLAGAYMAATSQTPSQYHVLYRQRLRDLLEADDLQFWIYSNPAYCTVVLAFEFLAEIDKRATEILRLCTFLLPEAIPEEVLTKGALELNGLLEEEGKTLQEALRAAKSLSLLHHDLGVRTISIHKIVQEVLHRRLNQQEQSVLAERAVRAVGRVFPKPEFSAWPECNRLLPQARFCAELVQRWGFTFPEARSLLHKAGEYLLKRGRPREAEHILQQEKAIWEVSVWTSYQSAQNRPTTNSQ